MARCHLVAHKLWHIACTGRRLLVWRFSFTDIIHASFRAVLHPPLQSIDILTQLTCINLHQLAYANSTHTNSTHTRSSRANSSHANPFAHSHSCPLSLSLSLSLTDSQRHSHSHRPPSTIIPLPSAPSCFQVLSLWQLFDTES